MDNYITKMFQKGDKIIITIELTMRDGVEIIEEDTAITIPGKNTRQFVKGNPSITVKGFDSYSIRKQIGDKDISVGRF